MSKESDVDRGADTMAAALSYLARGWSVVPIEARGKRPLASWLEFQHRHPAADEVAAWFRRRPTPNVAIVTGGVSGLVVLDIDPRHGGHDSLAALEARHGRLPATIEAITGGGGRHCYFAHPGGTVPNRAGLAAGIDLRGDGGLVVAPPSLHPSGARYAWRVGRAPDERLPAPLPSWLLGLAHGGRHPGHPLAYWRELVHDGVVEGQRNNTVASLAGHLLWHGVDAEVVLELLLAWNRQRCRPPLDDAEVAAVVHSIVRVHQRAGEQGEG